MRKVIDLTGQKFGRITVIERAENTKDGKIQWLCKCDCGNKATIKTVNLRSGRTQSCGCLHSEQVAERNYRHGKASTRLYKIWQGMIKRCYNEKSKVYQNYGKRGIAICNDWVNDFQAFYNWAITNGYADDLSIDRIDVNGDYEPNNCRWATNEVQASNKRTNHYITYNGKTQTMKQWACELGIKYTTLANRINTLNWTIEKALSTP